LPAAWRGTFRGLATPGIINHLKRLGVTTIELLPIHAFIDDRHLLERGLRNYWGYNTIAFFAPEPRYGFDNALKAFKSTVSQLHQEGIEVILDVVYNHTAEGNQLGPTLSFRGIDNASYYWLRPDDQRYYEDFTGCGNALNLTQPRVLQMVMDSLRYWVEQCHVDGFRFDLAATLGRAANGFDPHAAFFAAVAQDPVLAHAKLIGEPWDVGLGGYQVGAFPSGWSEWNDLFRRAMRCFWRGDANQIPDVAARLTGSADKFRHRGRAPRASVNHVTVHDGFTLTDLVSYAEKHNEANGEDNRDGADDNHSANWGIEGPTDDPTIVALRRQTRRNLLASMFLSHGIPLMLAGDEVGNSQNGNNNAYCQDNEIGWVDWAKQGQEGEDLADFVAELAALRRTRPQLQGHHWVDGWDKTGRYDILWLTPQAGEMTEENWSFAEARFLAYVLAPVTSDGRALFIVLNAASEPVEFVFPEAPGSERWCCVLRTDAAAKGTTHDVASKCEAPARAVSVFEGIP